MGIGRLSRCVVVFHPFIHMVAGQGNIHQNAKCLTHHLKPQVSKLKRKFEDMQLLAQEVNQRQALRKIKTAADEDVMSEEEGSGLCADELLSRDDSYKNGSTDKEFIRFLQRGEQERQQGADWEYSRACQSQILNLGEAYSQEEEKFVKKVIQNQQLSRDSSNRPTRQSKRHIKQDNDDEHRHPSNVHLEESCEYARDPSRLGGLVGIPTSREPSQSNHSSSRPASTYSKKNLSCTRRSSKPEATRGKRKAKDSKLDSDKGEGSKVIEEESAAYPSTKVRRLRSHSATDSVTKDSAPAASYSAASRKKPYPTLPSFTRSSSDPASISDEPIRRSKRLSLGTLQGR